MEHRPDSPSSPRFGRRQVLSAAGTLGFAALARTAGAAPRELAPAGLDGELAPHELEELLAGTCTATPTATEGPFYLDLDLLRKDITDGEVGVPLKVFLRVVRLSTCAPIPDVVVDLWHTNAPGRYSGFPSQGTAGLDFLRGYQITDAEGLVRYQTIYPGWYPGRTAHLHLKVHLTPTSTFTTQTYFPDPLTDEVYLLPPYDAHGPTPTHNTNDGFYDPRNLKDFLRVPDVRDGVYGGITIAIP